MMRRSVRRRAAMALTVLLGCACRGTGPESHVSVDVEVLGSNPDSAKAPGVVFASYFCRITLRAVVSGTGAARWHSGDMYLADGFRSYNSPPWDSAAIVRLWGGEEIHPGQVLLSDTVRATPATYLFVFRYRDLETGEIFVTDGTPATCVRAHP